MSKYEKLLARVLRGTSDANIEFVDIRKLLYWLEFEERIRGSHHVFRKEGVIEKVNIQADGKYAKAYQVRQIRTIIVNNHLGGKSDE